MPFRLKVLLIITGLLLHSRLPLLPEGWPLWPSLCLALVGLTAGWCIPALFPRHRLLFFVSALCLSVGGFFWAMWLALSQFEQRLPVTLEGEDFWLIGSIEGLPLVDADLDAGLDESSANRRSRRIDLRVEKTCLQLLPERCDSDGYTDVLAGTLVTLNDYSGLPLQAGERWQLRVRVNRPHGFANPGGSDFEALQFQRGVMARGYIRETRLNQRLPATDRINISRWRAALAGKIDSAGSADSPLASPLVNRGLIKALVLGDRQGISDQQWQLFTATGTNHLVVISGLHVGFVALCVWHLFNRVLRLYAPLLLYLPAQHGAALAAMVAAAIYSLLAGFSLPTQRALIMVIVLMWARLSGRQTRPGDSLALAALIILLWDPLAVVTAGFWLSFIAVASLFVVFAGIHHSHDISSAGNWVEQAWQRWLRPQWAVSVGLLLPLIIWTGQTSLNSPLANVFAIPLVSLLVVPLSLLGALLLTLNVPGAYALLFAADLLLQGLQWMLSVFVQWTPGLWRPPTPSLAVMVLAALGCLLLLLPRGLVPRWLSAVLLLPLVWPTPPKRPAFGEFEVQFLDVGQGLAVVIHTRHHNLLFDTGPALGPAFDAAQAAILPYLQLRHVRELDRVIVSHWHADHSGGLDSVLAQIPVQRVMAGGDNSALPEGIRIERCQAGQHWVHDGVSFSVLFPAAGYVASNINNQSCVLAVRAGRQQLLLTGDIETSAERWLTGQYSQQLASQLVQAPHHGSRSSSSAAFVQAVAADGVIFPAGYRNRFGHPHEEVKARYQDAGTQLYNTAEHGGLRFYFDGKAALPQLVSAHRLHQRRYWFNQPSVVK